MKRRILICLLTLSLLVSGISFNPASGTATEDYLAHGDLDSTYFSWKLTFDGTLTISGTSFLGYGDYTKNPWYPYRDYIKTVLITGTMDKIPQNAFCEFPELTRVIVDAPYLRTIEEYAFYGCPKLDYLDLGDGISSIGAWAFALCNSLESVFIPRNTYSCIFEEYSFYGCTNLEEVSFSGTSTIGENAFSTCQSLSRIFLYDYTEYFYLEAAQSSFSGVNAQVYYPLNSLKYLPDVSDYGGSLTWSETTEGPCGIGVRWSYDEDTKVMRIFGKGSVNKPYSSGRDMPWYGFCDQLLTIQVEAGITDIPSYAFEYCKVVTEVILPHTLKHLDLNAFNDCEKLNNLMLPSSLEGIGDDYYATYSFIRCNSLTDVYYLGTREEWAQVQNAALVDNLDAEMSIHYLVPQTKPPTCTDPGVETYYIFDETSVYSGMYDLSKERISEPDLLPPTGHSYGDWLVTQAPTCEEDGTGIRICLTCQAQENGTMTAPGHQFSGGICGKCGKTDPDYACITVLVTGYEDASLSVTLSLYRLGEATPSYTAQGTGITLEQVLPGEYRLCVEKDGYGVWEQNITVTPGAHEYFVSLLLLGDITGDGRHNVGDVSKLYAHVRGTSLLTDDYIKICADVTCDGKINVADTAMLYSVIRRTQ